MRSRLDCMPDQDLVALIIRPMIANAGNCMTGSPLACEGNRRDGRGLPKPRTRHSLFRVEEGRGGGCRAAGLQYCGSVEEVGSSKLDSARILGMVGHSSLFRTAPQVLIWVVAVALSCPVAENPSCQWPSPLVQSFQCAAWCSAGARVGTNAENSLIGRYRQLPPLTALACSKQQQIGRQAGRQSKGPSSDPPQRLCSLLLGAWCCVLAVPLPALVVPVHVHHHHHHYYYTTPDPPPHPAHHGPDLAAAQQACSRQPTKPAKPALPEAAPVSGRFYAVAWEMDEWLCGCGGRKSRDEGGSGDWRRVCVASDWGCWPGIGLTSLVYVVSRGVDHGAVVLLCCLAVVV